MGFWSRLFRRSHVESSGAGIAGDYILGYRFQNPGLLQEALTHRSYANSVNMTPTYERLEFLGDSVLGLLVARYLFEQHPQFTEGDLTKAKAALVNLKTLGSVARRENLGRYILLSPEEERAGGRRRSSILSDVLEAVIGAVYLDGGIDAATALIDRVLIRNFDASDSKLLNANFKGDLLELLQGEGQGLPRYEVVNETGPDHEKVFTVAVYANGREVGRGMGPNKKDAEQKAAREALTVLGRSESQAPVAERTPNR
ncbi:MAG: ribonuclease III [candidate division Zixibacteria bacterium]|nr:ribonuclease III [candidate division Zixibacteria bacterium]